MGHIQHNIEGFTEEEQKLLRTQYYGEEAEVTEDDMMNILGEAALGDSEEAAIKTTATTNSSEPETAHKLVSIEEELDGLKEKAAAIETELKSSSEKPE